MMKNEFIESLKKLSNRLTGPTISGFDAGIELETVTEEFKTSVNQKSYNESVEFLEDLSERLYMLSIDEIDAGEELDSIIEKLEIIGDQKK